MDDHKKKTDVEANIDSLYEMMKEFSERLSAVERQMESISAKIPEEIDVDDLYDEAKEIVLEYRKASTSFLQRKLRIGYSKAAALIDMLEKEEVVSGSENGEPRTILLKE